MPLWPPFTRLPCSASLFPCNEKGPARGLFHCRNRTSSHREREFVGTGHGRGALWRCSRPQEEMPLFSHTGRRPRIAARRSACRVPVFLNGKRKRGCRTQDDIPGNICGETAGKARDTQGRGSCRVSSGSPASVAAVHGTAVIRLPEAAAAAPQCPGRRRDGVRGAQPCRPHPGWSQYPACWRFRPRPWPRSGRSGPGRCRRPECPPRFR